MISFAISDQQAALPEITQMPNPAPVFSSLHQQLDILHTNTIPSSKNGLTIDKHVSMFNSTCINISDNTHQKKKKTLFDIG